MSRRASRAALFVSFALYLTSLGAPTLRIAADGGSAGWWVLVIGWLGLMAVPQSLAHLAWLANPALFAGWLTTWFHRGLLGAIFSLGGFLLAGMPLVFPAIVANESGAVLPITDYQFGYWFWPGAMIASGIGAVLLAEKTDR